MQFTMGEYLVKQHMFELQHLHRPRFTSQQSDIQPWPRHTAEVNTEITSDCSRQRDGWDLKQWPQLHPQFTTEPVDVSHYSYYCDDGHMSCFQYILNED